MEWVLIIFIYGQSGYGEIGRLSSESECLKAKEVVEKHMENVKSVTCIFRKRT